MYDDTTAVIILVSTFFVMLISRFPIAFAIGLSSLITALYMGLPLMQIAQLTVKGVNVFTPQYTTKNQDFSYNLLNRWQ